MRNFIRKPITYLLIGSLLLPMGFIYWQNDFQSIAKAEIPRKRVLKKIQKLKDRTTSLKIKKSQNNLTKEQKKKLSQKIKNLRKVKKNLTVKKLLRDHKFQRDVIKSRMTEGRQLTDEDKNRVKDRLKKQGKHLKDLNTEIAQQTANRVSLNLTYEEKAAVQSVEPNYLFELQGIEPNDTFYGDQWGLASIGNLPEELNETTNENEIIVAVIDTGVDFGHQDLDATKWTDENCVDENNELIAGGCTKGGYDFVDNDDDPFPADNYGHGQAVAGIIGAETNNANGMASFSGMEEVDVKTMSLRSCCTVDGFFQSDSITRAIYFAVNNGAQVINASFGGPTPSENILQAIRYARDNGVIFVAAAGNYASDNDTSSFYPTNYDELNIISVASIGQSTNLSYFSNYGDQTVDIAAPGESIFSTNIGANNYQDLSGTSFSTPLMSSVVSSLIANGKTTVEEIRNSLLDNVLSESTLSSRIIDGKVLRFEDKSPQPPFVKGDKREKKKNGKKEKKPKKEKKNKKDENSEDNNENSSDFVSVPEDRANFADSLYGVPYPIDETDLPTTQNTEFSAQTTTQSVSQISNIVYHHADHLTGANVDTNANAETISLIDYYPYGDTWVEEETTDYENDYKFTGKEKDEDTGLYYYEARYYDSGMGRFISIDPWGGDVTNPQTFNKYSYTLNNPVKYVDPDGRKVELVAKKVFWFGVHSFLKITPNNPEDFGLKDSFSFTLGGYTANGIKNLEGRINSKTDTTNLHEYEILESREISHPDKNISDTKFIQKLLNAYGRYDNNHMELYSPMASSGEYNCNSFANSLLTASGAGGIPEDYDPDFANPGTNTEISSMTERGYRNNNWIKEFQNKVIKPKKKKEKKSKNISKSSSK